MNGSALASFIRIFHVRIQTTLKAFLLISGLLLSTFSFSHDYFFAYAEVEYNDVSRVFETTIVATTHDVELALEEEKHLDKELDPSAFKDSDMETLREFLLEHFSIRCATDCDFQLLGFESLPNGITNFYLESAPIDITPVTEWHFDLLMSHFPDQQNKLTFLYRSDSYTLPFLPTTPTQILKLEE